MTWSFIFIFIVHHANLCLLTRWLCVCVQMSSDSDSDDENYYEMKKRIVCAHAQEMNILYLSASTIFEKYRVSWMMKADPRTSILTGFGWLQETIGTPGETFTMLRMKETVFFELHDLLKDKYGLSHSPSVSADTIHRKFHEVLQLTCTILSIL